MTKPSDQPACAGINPAFFDDPQFYQAGLEVCVECPAKLWCLNQVDPVNNWYDGVAGGVAWKDGKPLIDRPRAIPELWLYLARRGNITQPKQPADQVAAERLADGLIEWKRLTVEERKQTAIIMHRRGATKLDIVNVTHLRWPIVDELLTNLIK